MSYEIKNGLMFTDVDLNLQRLKEKGISGPSSVLDFRTDRQDIIASADFVIYISNTGQKTVIKNRWGNNDEFPALENTGYHVTNIDKGVLGEDSKIVEEFQEWQDAENQGSSIMELVELSDLYGAIEAYLKNKFNMHIDQLSTFSNITKRAFQNGHRS